MNYGRIMHYSATFTALSDEVTEKSCQLLQTVLANSIFMQQLYKKYHWHVQGPNFYELHLLFDKHANEQSVISNMVAERIRTLGGVAEGMPQDVLTNTTLSEHGDPGKDSKRMVENLLAAHEKYMLGVREIIKDLGDSGDDGTINLLTRDVLRKHELQVWLVRSSRATGR